MMATESIFMSTVFIAGILSFFAPCILPLLPVYVSHLSADLAGGESADYHIGKLTLHPMLIFKTFIFVTGLSTSFVILGFGAGALGSLISSDWFIRICGVVVIFLGIHQTGLVHIKALDREKKVDFKRSKKQDVLGTYLLGFTFSFGWTPCIGPVLGAVMALSASEGQALYGGWLMLIYALGLLIPFMIMAFFSDLLLGRIKSLNKHMGKIKVVGGLMIILMGLLLMTDQLNSITVFFESII
jgi:cytochrome c-type biogenesis protein